MSDKLRTIPRPEHLPPRPTPFGRDAQGNLQWQPAERSTMQENLAIINNRNFNHLTRDLSILDTTIPLERGGI